VVRFALASTASGARYGGSPTSQIGRKASARGPCPSSLLQSCRTTVDLIVHDDFSSSRVLRLRMIIGANSTGIYRAFCAKS
jgi:hypothetical protein